MRKIVYNVSSLVVRLRREQVALVFVVLRVKNQKNEC